MAGTETKVAMDEDVAEQLIDHIRNNTTDMVESEMLVPVSHYTSPQRAEKEIAFLKTQPLVIGHISELPAPGDFITREIFGMSLLISHARDGNIVSYRNMCPHRGGRVEQKESGHKHIFMCQYHGRSFNGDDGSMRPLSYEDSYGPIDYECSGLPRVATQVRHGLIFVTLVDQADQPLDEFIGSEVDAQLEPWRIAESVIHIDRTFELPVNWKLAIDGAVDSLHAQYLHPGPGNVGARTLTNVAVFRTFGPHGRLFMPRTRLKRLVDAGEEIVASTNYLASIMLLFPNALVAAAPDHLEFWTVWPSQDPSKCTVRIRFFVRPELLNPEMKARVNKSWEILENAATTEDWPMEIGIQANAASWPDSVFRFGRNEVSAQHLHQQIADALG